MGAKWQKFKLNLKGYDPAEREAIALEAIRTIIRRTQSGRDKNGERFPGYSKGYKKSAAFKIAGKSPGKVDLTLTEDMLDSLQILANERGAVQIGYENGSVENAKADGNIRGTYGQPSPIDGGKYARDFLGLTQSELRSILSKYPKGTEKSLQRAREELTKQDAADRLSGAVDVEELDSEEG